MWRWESPCDYHFLLGDTSETCYNVWPGPVTKPRVCKYWISQYLLCGSVEFVLILMASNNYRGQTANVVNTWTISLSLCLHTHFIINQPGHLHLTLNNLDNLNNFQFRQAGVNILPEVRKKNKVVLSRKWQGFGNWQLMFRPKVKLTHVTYFYFKFFFKSK